MYQTYGLILSSLVASTVSGAGNRTGCPKRGVKLDDLEKDYDPMMCTNGEFYCDHQHCDGIHDCKDTNDEKFCGYSHSLTAGGLAPNYIKEIIYTKRNELEKLCKTKIEEHSNLQDAVNQCEKNPDCGMILSPYSNKKVYFTCGYQHLQEEDTYSSIVYVRKGMRNRLLTYLEAYRVAIFEICLYCKGKYIFHLILHFWMYRQITITNELNTLVYATPKKIQSIKTNLGLLNLA